MGGVGGKKERDRVSHVPAGAQLRANGQEDSPTHPLRRTGFTLGSGGCPLRLEWPLLLPTWFCLFLSPGAICHLYYL